MLLFRKRIDKLSLPQILLVVFVIAFLIRLAFLATKPYAWTSKLQAGDEPLYQGLAVNLLNGMGYVFEGEPRSYPPPLYPFFIAAVYRVISVSPPAARVANALLGGILCSLIAWWAILLWGKCAGVFAGLAAAFYYPFVQLPVYLMTENLYLPLFLAAVMATWLSNHKCEFGKSPKVYWFKPVIAGMLWSLSALTREVAKPLAFLAAIWLAVRSRWQHALVLLIAIWVIGLPWSIRNRIVFRPEVGATNASRKLNFDLPFLIRFMPGGLLYMSFGPPGEDPKILGHWNWGSDVKRPQYPSWLPAHMRDLWLKAQAWDYIKSNPAEATFLRIPRKLANLLTPFYGTASLPNKVLMTLCYLLLLALSLPAWWRAWKSENIGELRLAELTLLVILFTLVFHAIFFGVVRYRYPVDALLLVFAGKALKELSNFLSGLMLGYPTGVG